jgi:GAG-pre-integrase domain
MESITYFCLEYMSSNIGLPKKRQSVTSKNRLKSAKYTRWKKTKKKKSTMFSRFIRLLLFFFRCRYCAILHKLHFRFDSYRHLDHPCAYMVDESTSTIIPDTMVDGHTGIMCNAASDVEAFKSRISRFESDSFSIKIDNCCTKTISGYKEDFIPDTLTTVSDKVVKGFGNTITSITHTGTIKWTFLDDENQPHHILINGAYYVPNSNIRLLSPQHWAQSMQDNHPVIDGTWCGTYKDKVILYWDQQRHKKTIMLDPNTNNIATMWSSPGSSSFQSYCTHIETTGVMNFAFPSEISNKQVANHDEFDHHTIDFDVDDPDQTKSLSKSSATDDLMAWHRRFGHLSMKKIQYMASKGLLPRRIATCPIPMCQSCLFGKMTRKAWRTKQDPQPSR